MVNVFFNLIFNTITPNLFTLHDIFIPNKNYDIIMNSFSNSLKYSNPNIVLKSYLSNNFINLETKVRISNTFCKAKRMYYFFKGFYRNYYFKKMSKNINNVSLCLVPFNQLTKKYIIKLREDDIIYKFYIFDLTKIIESSLTKCTLLIEKPKWPTNPYTNVNFSIENLVNIYFFLSKHNLIISNNFKQFYDCFFNLDLFHAKNQNNLRITSIKNYVEELGELDKYLYIVNMLYEYKDKWSELQIDIRYPRETIINLFEKQLVLYLRAKYCFCPEFRFLNKKKLIKQIKYIIKNNFFLGRVFRFNSQPSLLENQSYKIVTVNSRDFKNILDDDVTNEIILDNISNPIVSESYFIYTNFDLNYS